jgi:hypothetical protein
MYFGLSNKSQHQKKELVRNRERKQKIPFQNFCKLDQQELILL